MSFLYLITIHFCSVGFCPKNFKHKASISSRVTLPVPLPKLITKHTIQYSRVRGDIGRGGIESFVHGAIAIAKHVTHFEGVDVAIVVSVVETQYLLCKRLALILLEHSSKVHLVGNLVVGILDLLVRVHGC